jgi:hypothetical protein
LLKKKPPKGGFVKVPEGTSLETFDVWLMAVWGNALDNPLTNI